VICHAGAPVRKVVAQAFAVCLGRYPGLFEGFQGDPVAGPDRLEVMDVAKDAMEVLVASQESFLAGGAATIPYRMIYLATFVRVIR
jgi:hypothetical protein